MWVRERRRSVKVEEDDSKYPLRIKIPPERRAETRRECHSKAAREHT